MAVELFRDPIFDGATDPVLIRHAESGLWWLIYTARRATVPTRGFGWVHGSDLGLASSDDGGATWCYRGTVQGLAHEPGHNTFWAPEVVCIDGVFHMYVSYIRGVPETWAGHRRTIHHYTSRNFLDWEHHGPLPLANEYAIDACVFELPGGGYRLWYKNEADDASTWCADSDDLYSWHNNRLVLAHRQAAMKDQTSSSFRGTYWLIVDSWQGQLAYRSTDLEHWDAAGHILDESSGVPGTDDVGPGFHADVVVDGEAAYVVYFTHPGGPTPIPIMRPSPLAARRCAPPPSTSSTAGSSATGQP